MAESEYIDETYTTNETDLNGVKCHHLKTSPDVIDNSLESIDCSSSVVMENESNNLSKLGIKNSTPHISESKEICEFYKQGKCRFGDLCRNSHDVEVQIKLPTKSKGTKCKSKVEEVASVGKKPPMKTAGDVRDRILWDSNLPSAYFTLGYVDRFVGIVERPFSSFVWVDLCDAEPDDLAIPQHCMSYFKYKGAKVWDKETRMDHVFGSAGNKIKIVEKMAIIDEELRKKAAEHNSDSEDSDDEQFDVVLSGDMDIAGMGKQALNNIHNCPPRATHFLCIKVKNSNVIDEAIKVQETVYMQDATLRNCVMPKELFHVTLCMIRCETVSSLEHVRRLLDDIQPVLQKLVSTDTGEESSSSVDSEIKLERLTVDKNSPRNKDHNSQRCIVASGLSTFGARVLYAKLKVPNSFTKAVDILQDRIRTMQDVMITNNFDFIAHMTLIKINRATERERRSKYMNSCLYDEYLDHKFGTINFDNIHFCSIDELRGPDRFYQTTKIIRF